MANQLFAKSAMLSKSHNNEANWKPTRPNGVIHESVVELIGNTPIVKLNKIPTDHGVKCDIFVKCEFMNPGGSIKDRIAYAMMEDARKQGVVKENAVFIEPTSGNTGIGIALAATKFGYESKIVTNIKNSNEKVSTLRLLGADVIQTKGAATPVAQNLREHLENAVMLEQFINPVNPTTHSETTAVEILDAVGNVDAVVMGCGSGGTMTGVGYKIKSKQPNCIVVVAEPDGSTMINRDGKKHPFMVEGIGGSTVPLILDTSMYDRFEVVNDKESFLMARELARKEGLLCGGSSGCAVAAAIKAAKHLNWGYGKRVVVILPDGIRNYMTKFVNDQWMEANFFMDPPLHTMKWWNRPISDICLKNKYPILSPNDTCAAAVAKFNSTHLNAAIVQNEKGYYVGAVSKDGFRYYLTNPTKLPNERSREMVYSNDIVVDNLTKDVLTMAYNNEEIATIGRLARALDITPFVVLGNIVDKDIFSAVNIITSEELFDWIYSNYHEKL